MDCATFDRLVASIYAAGTCSVPWEAVLDQIRAAFDARMVFLQTASVRDGSITSIQYGGTPANDSVYEYVKTYHAYDPRRRLVMSSLPSIIGNWWHCTDHIEESFVAQDPFFTDFLSSYNARYTSAVLLQPGGPTDTLVTGFALELARARGPLSADERDVVRRLGDHLFEALRINRQVRELAAQALAGHRLLQTFPYPMWLLSSDRTVTFQTAAGAAEVENGRRLSCRNRRLMLCRQRADACLTESLHALFNGRHGATAVVDLRVTKADPPTWLHLAALAPLGALGMFGVNPQVLATLFDPLHVSMLDPFALSSMFSLTPAEARVATRLCDGLTAAEIGDQFGTSEATVRSQIREVLNKLVVPRTVDVVRVLRQGEALWSKAGTALL